MVGFLLSGFVKFFGWVGLWWVCGGFVVGLWWVYGRFVVGLWWVCGGFVVGL